MWITHQDILKKRKRRKEKERLKKRKIEKDFAYFEGKTV